MQQVLLNYCVNEFGKYLFIPHRVLRCVILNKRENCSDITPQSAQRKHSFLGKTREMSKTKKLKSRKKIALELLHQVGHRSTRSLLSGDTTNFWENIEVRIDPYPFCTSCRIYSINKEAR